MDEYVWKRTKMYESVKACMKMEKKTMDENKGKCMKTDKNLWKWTKSDEKV